MTAAIGLALTDVQRARQQQFDPGNMKQKTGDADPAGDQRHQNLDEESRERVAVEEASAISPARRTRASRIHTARVREMQ